ncbi:MAG: LacI family DNA-binding transcriptional regulator [Bacteroidales bacterium]|nr:LacI family DNA-binding transcriptional regulator [Bacteroidales bacterium]
MRSAQVTIKDIAEKLRISPSTVSRALKDHPDISKATKKAVKELAEKLNYEPNAIALSLLSSRSNNIGLIIPEIVHYFFSQVISGIEDVANDAGYHVIICQSNESFSREVKNVQALLSSRIEGLILSISKETRDLDHLKNLRNKNIPIVFFDRVPNDFQADQVVIDDYNGAYQAVKHLIDTGCRQIAHLGTTKDIGIGRDRYNGYIQALKDHRLSINERLIIDCDTYKAARLITRKLIYESNPVDGIFAVNDRTAIGALQTAKECGIKIPEEMAIVGFSNGIYSNMTDPPLTTVEQFGHKMGQNAARMLLDRLFSKEDYPPVKEVIKSELIIRGSTVEQRNILPHHH